MTRADLARRLGVSRAWVTRVLGPITACASTLARNDPGLLVRNGPPAGGPVMVAVGMQGTVVRLLERRAGEGAAWMRRGSASSRLGGASRALSDGSLPLA